MSEDRKPAGVPLPKAWGEWAGLVTWDKSMFALDVDGLMGSRAGAAEASWRAKVQAAIVIIVGVVAMVTGVGLVYAQLDNAELNAYRAAATCAAAADGLSGESCVYSGSATVTGSSRNTSLSLELAFTGLSGHSFKADFSTDREPDASSIAQGANVTAELWSGKVTRFAGVETVANPERMPADRLIGGVVFLGAGLVVIYWGIGFARNAWR